jgi:hypothetical protein
MFATVCIGAIGICLVIEAITLRAAVACYQKIGALTRRRAVAVGEMPSPAGWGRNAYTPAPFASTVSLGDHTASVREPGFVKACGIVMASSLANIPVLIANLLASTVALPGGGMAMATFSVPVAFLVSAAVLQSMLPTERFGTACLIKGLQVIVVALITLGMAAVVRLVVGP